MYVNTIIDQILCLELMAIHQNNLWCLFAYAYILSKHQTQTRVRHPFLFLHQTHLQFLLLKFQYLHWQFHNQNLPHARISTLRATQHLDAHNATGTAVVCHFQIRFSLNHFPTSYRGNVPHWSFNSSDISRCLNNVNQCP